MEKTLKYFTEKELACKCCGVDKTTPEFKEKLDELRELYGKPLIVNSAYRCPKHNAEVGGVKNSQHLLGIAADIKDVSKDFRDLAYSLGWTLIEYKRFTHIDRRENQIRIKGKY